MTPLSIAAGVALGTAALVAALRGLTSRQAAWATAPALVGAGALASTVQGAEPAVAILCLAAALALTSVAWAWAPWVIAALTIPMAWWSPAVALLGIALAAPRAPPWSSMVAAAAVTAACLVQGMDAPRALLLPATTALASWTCARYLVAVAPRHAARSTAGFLAIGGALGLVALIVLDNARGIVAADALGAATAAAVPAVAAGGAVALAVVGARLLLSASDPLGRTLIALALVAPLAAVLSLRIAGVALAITAAWAFGAGVASLARRPGAASPTSLR